MFRLSGIEVQEVSLVDRPANKRPFLVVKRDESDMTTRTKLEKESDGTLVQERPSLDLMSEAFDVDDITAITQSSLCLTQKSKARLASLLNKSAKRLAALAAAVMNATDGTSDDVPPSISREVAVVARALSSMIPTSGRGTNIEMQEQKKQDATDLDALQDDIEQTAERLAQTQKAGRKISRSRSEKLRAAQKILNDLIGELEPAPAEKTEETAKEVEPSSEASVDEKTKGKYKDKDKFGNVADKEAMQKSDDDDWSNLETPKSSSSPENVLAAALSAFEEKINTINANQFEISQIIKAQHERLEKIRNTHPVPNSDGEGQIVQTRKQAVWPVDFNRTEDEEDRFY